MKDCPFDLAPSCPIEDGPNSMYCATCAFRESRERGVSMKRVQQEMGRKGFCGPVVTQQMTRLVTKYECRCGFLVNDGESYDRCSQCGGAALFQRIFAQGPMGMMVALLRDRSEEDFPAHDFVWAIHD